ncbi:MAG: hypothetical protein ACPGD5_00800, partial [Salibacteraceae bacterium]
MLAGAISAQYYRLDFVGAGQNPGGINTDEDQTAAAMLANSTGYTQILNAGDTDWSGAETIPFSFEFNGNSYATIYVAPKGVVSFTASTGPGPGINEALPSSAIPDNSICAWGLNLSGGNDGVIVKTHGTAPNRQYWITWASASWTQGAGWAYWSIVLEESSNAVYIVDARNYVSGGTGVELTAGLQFDGSNAMMVPGSPSLAATNEATGGTDVGPDDNSYYAFYSGVQPDFDASMGNIQIPSYVPLYIGAEIKGTLTNLGTQTITEAELTYTIDGGAMVSETVTGLNIAPGGSAVVTHPTIWGPSFEGNSTIELWASMLNGNADANPGNDKASTSVIVYPLGYERTVLYETFTSSTCGPCVAGNANFEGIAADIPANEKASIKYQMSWPGDGDPYNTDHGNARRNVYQVSSVPNMQIDGGWDGNSGSFTRALHDEAVAIPSNVGVWAEFNVDIANQTVQTCAIIEANKDLGAATVHMAIKERLTENNVGTNGETEFHDVLKKLAAGPNGSAVTITAGMYEKVCVSYTFNGNYRLPNNSG